MSFRNVPFIPFHLAHNIHDLFDTRPIERRAGGHFIAQDQRGHAVVSAHIGDHGLFAERTERLRRTAEDRVLFFQGILFFREYDSSPVDEHDIVAQLFEIGDDMGGNEHRAAFVLHKIV